MAVEGEEEEEIREYATASQIVRDGYFVWLEVEWIGKYIERIEKKICSN